MEGQGGEGDRDRPRWTAKSAVRKDDQFTAAPDFIDEHDSDHLPLWGRIQASWHGLSRAGRVVVFASIALMASWGGSSVLHALDDLTQSSSTDPGGGLAADDAGQPPLNGVPEVPDPLPEGLPDASLPGSNSTSPVPAPLPSLPGT